VIRINRAYAITVSNRKAQTAPVSSEKSHKPASQEGNNSCLSKCAQQPRREPMPMPPQTLMPSCIGVTSGIKSYSYIIISCWQHKRRTSLGKRENDFVGEFIRHRAEESTAIYRGVKTKIPIIGAFKGS